MKEVLDNATSLLFELMCAVRQVGLAYHILLIWRSVVYQFFLLPVLEAQKTRAVKSRLVIVFHLIGLETDASCLDQSAVKHHQSKPGLLSTFY